MVKNYVWFNWLMLAVFGLSTVLAIFIVYFIMVLPLQKILFMDI